tara:strand:+ start:25996 stop:26685 length:690 start_codon:yes stop_codon:yes gene_type:complete
MNLAIIPARGGSKRIPRKNIKDFCGHPIIKYPIQEAKKSNLFDKIIVSTDDEEIAEIAKSFNAETPFLRPKEFSDDHSSTVSVVVHAINFLKKEGYNFENICCIYPCSPLLRSKDLIASLNFMREMQCESCIPICEFSSAPQKALKIKEDGRLDWIYSDFKLSRTQDLEQTYHDIGSFYWATQARWLSEDISQGVGYIFNSSRVVDIDTSSDWKRAELLYKSLNHDSDS